MYAPVIAAVTLLATGAVAQGINWDTFDSKCKNVNLLGEGKVGQTTLTGSCLDDAGGRWQTSLNLNLCIWNDLGKLAWGKPPKKEIGNFDQECNPCLIDKMELGPPNNVGLKCNCLTYLTKKPLPKLAEITLTPNNDDAYGIKLVDGRFVCGPHEGNKTEST